MKRIIDRTLEITVKKSSIIVMGAAGILCGLLMNEYVTHCVIGNSYEKAVNSSLAIQHLLVFFVFAGLLLIMCASVCTGLIAGENADGTLRLLVAKPNSRLQILFGKIIGSYLGLLILALEWLLLYFACLMLKGNLDGNVLNAMLNYFPGYLIYGVIIIFIFLSISILLSCIFKKKIPALLPVLAIIIVILAVFPIQRIIADLASSGNDGMIDYIDINYHLALIFKSCISPFGQFSLTNGEVIGYLMKLVRNITVDRDVYFEKYYMLAEYKHFSASIVMSIYLIVSSLFYGASALIMKRKDV